MTNDYLRCSKDVEYCRDWYLEKNKGTWNQTIVKESTPSWVVKDMVDLLPEDSFTLDAKFIDIFSKSGIFLEVIRNKLMRNQAHIDKFPDPKERFNYITRNQLYALVWCDGVEDVVENQLALTTVAIYGRLVDNPNVYRVEIDRKTLKKEEGVHKFIELFYSEEYFKGMKFNTVIGNPPYNNDIYIDFVRLGQELSTKNSVWITPAKWQVKGTDKNDAFRQDIVPYISKIVYYPMASDVFNIAETGGISYYLIDKVKHNSRYQAVTCDNTEFSEKMHQTNDTYLYNSIINHIMKNTNGRSIQCRLTRRVNSNSFLRQYYLHESYKPLHVIKDENNSIEVMSGGNIKGYCNKNELYTIENIEKYKVIIPVMVSAGVWACIPNYGTSPLTKLKPYQVPIGSYPIIAFFDTEKECNSFLSYCGTKLVKLLHYIGISATTESSDFWRFVPDPGKFDHEFTDKELYNKYNLTSEEINLIESVIKERK